MSAVDTAVFKTFKLITFHQKGFQKLLIILRKFLSCQTCLLNLLLQHR